MKQTRIIPLYYLNIIIVFHTHNEIHKIFGLTHFKIPCIYSWHSIRDYSNLSTIFYMII